MARKCLACYIKPWAECNKCKQPLCEECYWKLDLKPFTMHEYNDLDASEVVSTSDDDNIDVDMSLDIHVGHTICPTCKGFGPNTFERYDAKPKSISKPT